MAVVAVNKYSCCVKLLKVAKSGVVNCSIMTTTLPTLNMLIM